ncbi:MAG TPA: PaaI family thioesterase [Solirubrobacteraceae bacterium]
MIERADGQGERRERRVSWDDPAPLAAAASSLSGLKLLNAIIDGRLPPPPIAKLFGAELVSAGEGFAVFHCTPDESTYNPMGIVHGGFLCTLLDTAAGCAVHSLLPAGTGFGSIEIKVSFLKPLTADSGEIEIRGQALRVGTRVAFAEAHARGGDGELVGHATTSIALIGSSR